MVTASRPQGDTTTEQSRPPYFLHWATTTWITSFRSRLENDVAQAPSGVLSASECLRYAMSLPVATRARCLVNARGDGLAWTVLMSFAIPKPAASGMA